LIIFSLGSYECSCYFPGGTPHSIVKRVAGKSYGKRLKALLNWQATDNWGLKMNIYNFIFYRTYKFVLAIQPTVVPPYMVAIQIFSILVGLNLVSIVSFFYYKINIRFVTPGLYLFIIFCSSFIFNYFYFKGKYLRIESFYEIKNIWFNNGYTLFLYVCLTLYLFFEASKMIGPSYH